jgi:hypothetical protein
VEAFAKAVLPQILAGEPYVVSHAFNSVRIAERHQEIQQAFAQYAPRREGDDEYDVKAMLPKWLNADL